MMQNQLEIIKKKYDDKVIIRVMTSWLRRISTSSSKHKNISQQRPTFIEKSCSFQ